MKLPEYHVEDKVRLTVNGEERGPYTVATVIPSTKRYTLVDDKGVQVNDGQEVDEADLTPEPRLELI